MNGKSRVMCVLVVDSIDKLCLTDQLIINEYKYLHYYFKSTKHSIDHFAIYYFRSFVRKEKKIHIYIFL